MESHTSEEEVIREGWLRKKGTRVNVWGDRFFVLKGNTLFYYAKSIDSVQFTSQLRICISSLFAVLFKSSFTGTERRICFGR